MSIMRMAIVEAGAPTYGSLGPELTVGRCWTPVVCKLGREDDCKKAAIRYPLGQFAMTPAQEGCRHPVSRAKLAFV